MIIQHEIGVMVAGSSTAGGDRMATRLLMNNIMFGPCPELQYPLDGSAVVLSREDAAFEQGDVRAIAANARGTSQACLQTAQPP
jgi:hypothetical protein